MPKRRTNEEFYFDMNKIHPDMEITGEYINNRSRMHIKHLKCNYEWDTDAQTLYKHGCPKCGNSVRKTQDEFIYNISINNPDITVIGTYVNEKTKIKVFNNRCNHEYDAFPNNIKKGCGCPICDGKKVLKEFNSISKSATWMLDYIINSDDADKYTPFSHKSILMRCKDCGHEEMKIIKNVYLQGFGCSNCGDGVSYPNKILRSLLKQLPVDDLCFEYSPDWLEHKRYDGYFVFNNKKYVVEMDGNMHYKDIYELHDIVQERDILKENLAREHGIEVIRIDSRESKLEYIKESIINSKLNIIFDLSIIDWEQCGKFAQSNIIKSVCEYYNNNKYRPKDEIINFFDIPKVTYEKYLRIGRKVGWIDETDCETSIVRSLNSHFNRSIPVKVFSSDNKMLYSFPSCLSCAKFMSKKYEQLFCATTINKYVKSGNNVLYHGFYFRHLEL